MTFEAEATAPGEFRVVVVMPVYRDWESASALCKLLDHELARLPGVSMRVLMVDDRSPDGITGWKPFEAQSRIDLLALRLRSNVGHQRAICIGICYIHEHLACDCVLVMDADGEDKPEDAIRLIQMGKSNSGIYFAERRKRLERLTFRVGYKLFRTLHRMLTGISVRVGNFSILPYEALGVLTCMPELWNHYAGAVLKSKLRLNFIPMDRGSRLYGKSQMNLVSLVTHGIAGIATFYTAVATRILICNVIGLFVLLIVLSCLIGIRLFTDLAIPGWTTYAAGLTLVLATQLAAISFSLVFSLISSRTNVLFIPLKDYAVFVQSVDSMRSSN
jgi:hypothetical protein